MSRLTMMLACLVTAGAAGTRCPTSAPVAAAEADAIVWSIDNLRQTGGHPVLLLGAPRVVQTHVGSAVEFDGCDDGLVLDVNLLAGLDKFTIEAVFEPAPDGPTEQRFLHMEEAATGNRALLETRLLADGAWALDTFLRSGVASRTLLNRRATHPTGRWHTVALVFDGATMSHYVNQQREASGPVAFQRLGAGRTSIGVRLNRVHWFKGKIQMLRVTPRALTSEHLLRIDGL